LLVLRPFESLRPGVPNAATALGWRVALSQVEGRHAQNERLTIRSW
jgi:hypothetical protein